MNGTEYPELCVKCGDTPKHDAFKKIDTELKEKTAFIGEHVVDFPMFTTAHLPRAADYRLKAMITANITVGTGFFSEFSQGFSDLTGAVNATTGMSYKVNKGEASARSILVSKAIALGANCIIGVDIDNGTTGNNAATINMQGTAAVVSNMEVVLHETELAKANDLHDAYVRIEQLNQWRARNVDA